MKSFEIHRIPDLAGRRVAFEALEPKIWWENAIFSTLVIADPAAVANVMRDANFVSPDIRSLTRELSRRHSVPLARVQETMSVLPLLLEGEQHMRIRKILATFLSERLQEIDQALPGIIAKLLDDLPDTGEAELVSGLVAPIVREVFARLGGRELTDEIMSFRLVSIFEGRHSITSLTRLDDMLGKVHDFLEQDSRGDDDFICRLCCLVFGLDNVFSSLAENLAAAFEDSDGDAPVELSAYPTQVMIAALYRQALQPTDIEGHPVQPSTLVRLQLAPVGYSTDKAINAAVFGVGRHACIGKQLSLSIWKHLSEQFNARRIRGRITDYQSHATHTFNFVQTLRVSIES